MPDPDMRNETWHNSFCQKDELATALLVLPSTEMIFQLQCGQGKEIRADTCPFGINGLHIVKLGKVIAEFGVSCLSGDHYDVYKNHSMGEFELPRHYKCSEGYGVCGVGLRNCLATSNENCGSGQACGALRSQYLCKLWNCTASMFKIPFFLCISSFVYLQNLFLSS